MNDIRLSICIPTYNRKDFLREALESIFLNLNDFNKNKIEICISDNASTDNTQNMIEEIRCNALCNIVYYRHEENLGADRNYLKVIEIASGKYCWFLGSDDKINEGSLTYILDECFTDTFDILLFNRLEYDFNMKALRKKRYWLNQDIIESKYFDMKNNVDKLNYFDNALSVGAVFSYLSSIVFNREKWNKVKNDESYIGTAYVHVYKLLMMMNLKDGQCVLKYEPKHLVMSRGDNDSFNKEGDLKRFMIDIDGYLKLSSIMKRDEEKRSFLEILKRENNFLRIYKMFVLDKKSLKNIDLLNKLVDIGYDRNVLLRIKRIADFTSFSLEFLLFLNKLIKKMRKLV